MRPLLLALLLLTSLLTQAQPPKTYTSSEILLGLKKLNVLGSVLYIAAHPDDENTRLLAYLANERLVETAYLSITRGDGGQNLVGPELREGLGVIRTQELLAARRIDGAQQFFTRANDFGFSKTSAETFTIWDREQVLADMVWVIRQRRPDVLITRFPPDARAGHGHHAASAILAADAFDAAGDPQRFPEQLQYVQPWQPKRLLWNTGSFFVKPGEDMSSYFRLDVGGYNPLLGQSYGEIAARSRSQHRSQGFGSAAQRGESIEYFQLVKGEPVKTDLFDGVDLTWNRVPGGAKVGKLVEGVIRGFDAGNPSGSVAGLQQVKDALIHQLSWPEDLYEDNPAHAMSKANFNVYRLSMLERKEWQNLKLDEVNTLIKACVGLYLSATISETTATPGQHIKLNIEAVNRSAANVTLNKISIYSNSVRPNDTTVTQRLLPNQLVSISTRYTLPVNMQNTQPYWLREKGSVGMYKVAGNSAVIAPDNGPVILARFIMDVAGIHVVYNIPVQYKHTDPTLGELYQPLVVTPPVMVNLPAARAYIFNNLPAQVSGGFGKKIPVTVRAGRAGVAGTLALQVPVGWQVEPASIPFTLKDKDDEQTISFLLRPSTVAEGRAEVRAVATVDGQPYTRGIQTITYPHIPTQTLFPEATDPLVKLDVRRGKAQTVGYLMGAGDEVPEALRQLGYTVTLLDAATDLTAAHLARYDAVVLGIRAYNTVERLKTQQPELLQYVEQGGNLIVQYNTDRGLVLPQIGPYPLTLSRDRVTVEDAPVTFLAPKHPLLNTPNTITAQDFTGWVQEQGLYYPSAWDAKYTPIIASHDPGEDDKKGAILVADYGKGHYIYTGLSFFRELPAGVPGAYRLLANMVSYGK